MEKFAGMIKYMFMLILLMSMSTVLAQNKFTINGYVANESGEMLIGANVYIPSLTKGAVTNKYGFYSITLPQGEHELYYSYIGYNEKAENISLDKDIRLNIRLEPQNRELKEVVVSAERIDRNIQNLILILIGQ